MRRVLPTSVFAPKMWWTRRWWKRRDINVDETSPEPPRPPWVLNFVITPVYHHKCLKIQTTPFRFPSKRMCIYVTPRNIETKSRQCSAIIKVRGGIESEDSNMS